MAKKSKNKNRKQRAENAESENTLETRPVDVITVAWTVSVTAVLLCDLVAVVATLLANGVEDPERPLMLQHLMLLFGSVIGAISLILMAVVFRLRKLSPPLGFAVFAALVSIAPIMALVGILLRW